MAERLLQNSVSVEVKFDRTNLQRKIEAMAEAQALRTLERMADVAVQETEAIIRKEFINDRAGRRRKSRSVHLLGSIRSKIDGEGRDRKLIIYSTADPKKVGALEHGADTSYRIHASDAEDGFLYFPSNLARRPPPVGPTPRVAHANRVTAYTPAFRSKGLLLTKKPGVAHKAFKGKHFMLRGGERAFKKVNGGG